jgi:cation diffusion facilitator CzcD-associated flavoprotein CzcO
MLAYMNRVADKYDIKKHLQPNTEWLSSTWDDERKVWSVELQNNKTGKISVQECKVLIGAIGHQVDPKPFEVPGIEEFRGKVIHSCKWPEGLDLKGKNVVVSGNGSK